MTCPSPCSPSRGRLPRRATLSLVLIPLRTCSHPNRERYPNEHYSTRSCRALTHLHMCCRGSGALKLDRPSCLMGGLSPVAFPARLSPQAQCGGKSSRRKRWAMIFHVHAGMCVQACISAWYRHAMSPWRSATQLGGNYLQEVSEDYIS